MKTAADTNVLVTGAAMGMGRLYAERAIAEGAATVVLWDINADALETTRTELAAAGADVRARVIDVTDHTAVTDAVAELEASGIGIDVLINNAGVVRSGWFWEQDLERDIEFTLRVNTLAPMAVARAIVPGMIERGREAHVLNVASAAGTLSNPKMAAYASSKWAVLGWSDSMRLELAKAGHHHVAVTTFCPSYIDTGMFAGARGPTLTPIMKPEYAVDRAWRAMLKGAPVLYLPWSVNLSKVLRGILPTRVWDVVGGTWFGVYRSMDEFRGREGTAK